MTFLMDLGFNAPIPVLAQSAGQPSQAIEAFVISLVLLMGVGWIGGAMATKDDKEWLQGLVVWGFVAKLAGTFARFYMVTVLYEGGDSIRYHGAAQVLAKTWRGFVVPVSSAGSEGTAFTEVVTGFVYALYTPTLLGGFIVYAALSFLGQLLFYAAFRPWMPPRQQKLYAIAVFFLPSLVFWPSSIGKDALMVLFLGAACYGASRLLRTYTLSSVFIIAPALALAAGIRPHVASILGLALVLALLFGKPPKQLMGSAKRVLMLLVAAIGTVAVLTIVSSTFELSFEGGGATQELSTFLEDVSERTATGGSEITGGAVSNPSQLPAAFVTVLFRPLIHEGTNPQVILSALEGTALLLLVIWKLPTMWRNKRLLREKSYLLLALFYTGGFVVGFSAILNLGILARQRVQVLPLLLAWIVGLGWDESEPTPAPHVPKGTQHSEPFSGPTTSDKEPA